MSGLFLVSYNRAFNEYLNGTAIQIYGDGKLLDILQRGHESDKRAKFDFITYVVIHRIWCGNIFYMLSY